jgi:hypothetical protein
MINNRGQERKMAKSKDKKTKGSKPSVRVSDLEPKKDPKGAKKAFNDILITHTLDKATPK